MPFHGLMARFVLALSASPSSGWATVYLSAYPPKHIAGLPTPGDYGEKLL